MPKGYNGLSKVKVNHAEIGICPTHGYLLTSEQCDCFPEMRALFFVAEQSNYRDKHTFPIDMLISELPTAPVTVGSVDYEDFSDLEAMHNYIDEYAESYKRFQEANKPNDSVADEILPDIHGHG